MYNVHQISHLPLYVKRFGRLFGSSGFFFEGYNLTLKRMIHGTTNPAKELVNGLKRTYCLNILKRKLSLRKEGVNFCCVPFNRLSFHRLDNECSDADKEFLFANYGIRISSSIFHARVKNERETFTSPRNKAEKMKNNYTVCFHMSRGEVAYGEIKCFLVLLDNITAFIYVFNVDHSKVFYHSDKETSRSDTLVLRRYFQVRITGSMNILGMVFRREGSKLPLYGGCKVGCEKKISTKTNFFVGNQ